MDLLRFITCGSVDDGKSTLIGRLLFETKLIFEDQLEALKAARHHPVGGFCLDDLDQPLHAQFISARRERGSDEPAAILVLERDVGRALALDADGFDFRRLQSGERMLGGHITAGLEVNQRPKRGHDDEEQRVQPRQPDHILRRRHQITAPVIMKASGITSRKANAIR